VCGSENEEWEVRGPPACKEQTGFRSEGVKCDPHCEHLVAEEWQE